MAGFNRGNPFSGFSGFGGKNAAPMRMPVQQFGRPASMPEFLTRPSPTPGATYNGRAVAPMTETPPQIEDPPLPPVAPAKKKLSSVQQMARNIKWAAKNGGSPMAGIAAILGVPMQQKRRGQWMTVDPGRQSIYPMGTTPYYGPGAAGYGSGNGNGGGGGDTPPTDPNAPPPLPGDKYKKNLIPEWWKDWYRTQGQYGGVPPVEGLL